MRKKCGWMLALCSWCLATPLPAWAVSKQSFFPTQKARVLALSGTTLFVGDGTGAPGGADTRVLSINISSPSSPVLLQTLPIPRPIPGSGDAPTTLDTNGTILGTNGPAGIVLIDASNPSAMMIRSTTETFTTLTQIVVNGNLAYAVTTNQGFQVLDITNPDAPTVLFTGSHFSPATTAMEVVGNILYGVDGEHLVRADVSVPTSIPSADSGGGGLGSGLVIFGTTAYAGTNTRSSFRVLSLTTPHPTVVSEVPTGGHVQSMTSEGNRLFVGEDDRLEVYDITTPTAPGLIGNYIFKFELSPGLIGGVPSIKVAGNTAYLALGEAGVGILDVSSMSTTPIPPPPLLVYEPDHTVEVVVPDVGATRLVGSPSLAHDTKGNAYYVKQFGMDQGLMKATPDGSTSLMALVVSPGGAPGQVKGLTFDLQGNMLLTLQLADNTAPLVRVTGFTTALHPPQLVPIGNKSIAAGKTLKFRVSATDVDGDTLSYSASNLPPGSSFDPSTRTFRWTPTAAQKGTYPGVYFEVTDKVYTVSESITITVF